MRVASFTLCDVFPKHLNILVPIRSALFVPETDRVHHFVHHCAFMITSLAEGQFLAAISPVAFTHRRPAAVSQQQGERRKKEGKEEND